MQTGDFVNFVRGKNDGGKWVGHVGLVIVDESGQVNVIHSASPAVREEPLIEMAQRYDDRRLEILEEFDEKKAKNEEHNPTMPLGFKFLRLHDDPVANLMQIDGPNGPKISWSTESYDYYVEEEETEEEAEGS